jgi:hypothetical protein
MLHMRTKHESAGHQPTTYITTCPAVPTPALSAQKLELHNHHQAIGEDGPYQATCQAHASISHWQPQPTRHGLSTQISNHR